MNTKIKTALAISVTFNILVIGLILGGFSHGFSHYFEQNIVAPSVTDCCSSELEGKLSAEKRQLFNDMMRPAWEKMQSTRAQINVEKKKALDLLKAGSFDEKVYRNQIHYISDMYAQMKRDMAEVVIKIAKEFTPEERVILANIVANLSISSLQTINAAAPQAKP